MSRALPTIVAALAISTPALAEEPARTETDKSEKARSEGERQNDTILVVGQRDAPIEIEPRGLAVSLGREEFEAINAVNTEDLMKYAPNFFVRKRYSGDSNGVPGFRGTHSTQSARTLVMVDGFVVSNFLGNSFNFPPKWGVVGPGEVEQFDIVYGPYSSRYIGNSMGGIVNITTRNPTQTEAFATVQGFLQPYDQFSTKDNYYGYSAEAGVGLKQKNGPFSVRLSARYFHNEGQPMQFLGLVPATGASGTVVTGAVVDPEHVKATADGRGIPGAPGNVTNPYFAAQSPALITQEQLKLKVGYDDGSITGQFLFAFWHNEDRQHRPDCYLRDANDNVVCDGRVRFNGQTFTASGANFSDTLRNEYLLGFKVAAPIATDTKFRLALSTYQIPKADVFTSNGYLAGKNRGAGTLARQGPTGWWTGDLSIEHAQDSYELAGGLTANAYQSDQTRYNLIDWRSDDDRSFLTRTFGKTRQLSAWLEGRYFFDPFKLTAGVRYDNWHAYSAGLTRLGTGPLAGQKVSNEYDDRNQDTVDPSLSIEYKAGADTDMQLSLAKATRYPTVGELFQGSLNGDGSFNINSFDPNLKPERSRDANFLIAHDFQFMKLTGSIFYQRVKNTIFQFIGFNQNGVSTSTFKNIDVTRQYGIEAIAEMRDWPIAGMNIDFNAAYTDSKTVRNDAAPAAEGVQFPRIPKWRINGNIRYGITETLEASLGMRYASRPNTDLFGLQRGDTFGFTSELFALDARVNWDVLEHFRISAGVDNITNNRAWVFHPYPQRSFLLELGWRM